MAAPPRDYTDSHDVQACRSPLGILYFSSSTRRSPETHRQKILVLMEEVAGQRLPLCGVNGYNGVRRQGRDKNKFQGTTPQKFDRTKLFDTPRDAAIALAQLKVKGGHRTGHRCV